MPSIFIKLWWIYCSCTITSLGVLDLSFPANPLLVEIYPSVKRLQTLLEFNFEYPTKNIGRRSALHLPELQLMSLIVISTKLLFPFDDTERYPTTAREPTTQVIDWELWAQAQRHFANRETSGGQIGKGNEILVKEKDVFNMTPSQLDEYMDWYENSWLDSKVTNLLADMFPIGPTVGESQNAASTTEEDEEEAMSSMNQKVTSELKARKMLSNPDVDIPRPGNLYQRYRKESDLPDAATYFYEIAAKVAGVSLSTLIRAVFQAETKISRWLEDQRRIEYYGDPLEAEISRDDNSDDAVADNRAISE
ncbi:hypothetical protein EYZ11_001130 [Aspergillus tanneri]|uniref:Rrn7/TAF1B C-terminal cyclin domain-containing protein n=1 Tax=Aspergillus tanneri TaxID=1220188 RepID=A0A4S3JVF7_9EURO|nr:hypothetical protein EYZ11_001130 [Aspergillus tanneri]